MDLEHELADMRDGTQRLEQRIRDVRADWERKRRDPRVPGAPAPDHDPHDANGGAVAGDWEGEGPAANRAGQ
ncbi:MAG TPA: hypothetical protein VFV85_02515 [Conexibacter sp.]|nr:hypothetical protein [Conexibacter sp.]